MNTVDVVRRLSEVFDPELGLDIVSLGLVYEVEVHDGHVAVRMATTSPLCPLGDALAEMVRQSLDGLPGVETVTVELASAPAWDVAMASEEALRHLGVRARR